MRDDWQFVSVKLTDLNLFLISTSLGRLVLSGSCIRLKETRRARPGSSVRPVDRRGEPGPTVAGEADRGGDRWARSVNTGSVQEDGHEDDEGKPPQLIQERYSGSLWRFGWWMGHQWAKQCQACAGFCHRVGDPSPWFLCLPCNLRIIGPKASKGLRVFSDGFIDNLFGTA